MKNGIKSALMLFGKEKQLSKDLFIRQSGCSEDDILIMSNEGYITIINRIDNDELLALTKKGEELIWG